MPHALFMKIYSGTQLLSIRLYNVADTEPIEGDDGFPLVMEASVFTPNSRPPTLCLDHRPATKMSVVASSTCLCPSHSRPPHTYTRARARAHTHTHTHTHTHSTLLSCLEGLSPLHPGALIHLIRLCPGRISSRDSPMTDSD